MSFNQEQFLAAWHCLKATDPPRPPADPFSLHILKTVASTNQILWDFLNQGADPGTVVIAESQTAGRGQWGRQWQSGAGGLYLSLALAPNLPASDSAHLTLCSAWGIANALRNYDLPVWLKWPNDLLLGEHKLGGILTETRVRQGRIAQAVIGVGINWSNPVLPTGLNLQSFQARLPAPTVTSLEMLAAITLQGLRAGYHHLQGNGINSLLPAYQELLTAIGHPVEVNGHRGVVVGVAATGELRVRLEPQSPTPLAESVELGQEICLKPGTISLGYKSRLPSC